MDGTTLHCWGLDHHVADTALRERAHLDRERINLLLGHLRGEEGFIGAVPVGTCNRTELYVEARSGSPITGSVERALAAAGIEPSLLLEPPAVHREDLEAVRHLYRVTAGLESQLVGEPQIVGQLKDAYRLAKEHHSLGPVLMRAFQGAFRTGKRVRSETRIGNGAVSVAFAAVELSRKIYSDLSQRTVLLVGTGETGALAARHFLQQGARRLVLVNRTRERAEALAAGLADESAASLAVRGWEELEAALGDVDLVLSSTGSPVPVLTEQMVAAAVARRHGRPLLLLDIAVPRDIAPGVADLDCTYLFGLDDLDEIVRRNLAARRQEIPRAEKIIARELEEFSGWLRDMDLRPTVSEFRAYLEGLKEQQVGYVRRTADPRTAAAVEESLQHFIKKVLGRSMAALKETSSPEERRQHLDVLRRLFGQGDG